jgi:hypothetical protein
MKKMLGCWGKIILFLLLISLGVFGYIIWRNENLEDLKISNLQDFEDLFWKTSKSLGSEIQNGAQLIGERIENEWESFDWNELKSSVSLSEKEWQDYRESLNFLKPKDEVAVVESKDISSEDQKNSPPVLTSPKIKSIDSTSKNVSELKGKDDIAQNSPPQQPSNAEEWPHLSHSSAYQSTLATLENAKEDNRKGLPSLPNYKVHLKKSLELYKKCQISLLKIQKNKNLTTKELESIEILLSDVGQQIYWGSKFSSLQ